MTDVFEYTDYLACYDSSLLHGAWYNEESRTLVLDVNHELREYSDVSPYVWNALVGAESLGRFYNRHIKGQFSGQPANYDHGGFDYVQDRQKLSEGQAFNTTFGSEPLTEGQMLSTTPPAEEEYVRHRDYSIRFTFNGVESVFRTTARHDLAAEEEFKALTDRLGLYDIEATLERAL